MNRLKLAIVGALSCLYFSASAQFEQGTVLLGLSSDIGGSSIFGLSLESNEVRHNQSSFQDSLSHRNLSYNAGIKAGYFLGKQFAIGVDIYYGNSSSLSENDLIRSNRSSLSGGPFMRYYLPSNDGMLFYIEAVSSFGRHLNYYSTEGSFNSSTFIEENTFLLSSSLALGLSLPLSEMAFLDFALAGNYIYSWDPNENKFASYNITRGFNLKLGFSIYLN